MSKWSKLDAVSATISSEDYGFDVMSRLTSVNREDNKRDAFGYDFSSQLTTAQYGFQKVNNVWENPQRPVSYTWDKAGNRDHVVDTGSTTNYTTTNLNQYIVAGADAVYNGSQHEISNYQGKNYGYVNDERLASITSATDSYQMAYDALGRCVRRALNGVVAYYVYDGEKPILEYNNVYQRVGANIYGKGIDEILGGADYTVSPSVSYWYQHDHEGSVTHLTDANGAVIESYRYDAFGAPTIYNSSGIPVPVSGFNNRFLFTGREYAQKFGVYEYRNRAYHPGLGRFTSEDPMGFAAGDLNLFRYCGNDPIDLTDPMGLEPLRDLIEGFADGVSFGATDFLRENVFHSNGDVDKNSEAYKAGQRGSLVAGMVNGKTEGKLAIEGGKKLVKKVADAVKRTKEIAAVRKAKEAGQNYEEILKAQKMAREEGKPHKIEDVGKARQNDKRDLQDEGKRALERQKARESQQSPDAATAKPKPDPAPTPSRPDLSRSP